MIIVILIHTFCYFTGYNSFQYNSKLVKAIAVTILGNACSILCLTLMALFLTYIGMSKCWFSKPILAVGLYLPAGLIGLLLVHMVARKTVFKVKQVFYENDYL